MEAYVGHSLRLNKILWISEQQGSENDTIDIRRLHLYYA
jgi:hypothetical protein